MNIDSFRRRRSSDLRAKGRLSEMLREGDISLVCIFAGLELILWPTLNMLLDLKSPMLPQGGSIELVLARIATGMALWYLAISSFPALASLLVGSWMVIFWVWLIFAKISATDIHATGLASSFICVLLGLLVIHRSAKR
jgi:hypothetical protein